MSKGFNMSQADLLSLVDQVKVELAGLAKSEAAKSTQLAKAEDDEKSASASDSVSGSPEASASDSASMPAEASAEAPAPVSDAPANSPAPAPADEAAAPAEAPADGQAPAAPGGEAAGPTMQELVSLYAALPPEDFEAHAMAIQQVAQSKAPQGAPGPDGAGAPPPAGPSAPPMDPTMKSEGKVKELEGQLANLQKSMAEMTQVVEGLGKIATMPRRQATTGFTYVPMAKSETQAEVSVKKFEEMDQKDLMKSLTEMTNSSKLSKSERDLVTSYCLGNAKREELVVLFNKEKK